MAARRRDTRALPWSAPRRDVPDALSRALRREFAHMLALVRFQRNARRSSRGTTDGSARGSPLALASRNGPRLLSFLLIRGSAMVNHTPRPICNPRYPRPLFRWAA